MPDSKKNSARYYH